MKRIIIKIQLIIFLITLFLIINISKVYAATFTISCSTTTVEPGGSFNVILNSNGAGYINLSCSNGTLSENYVWVEGTKTVTCRAASSGTKVTISASGVIADFTTGNDENKSGSTSVQIKEKPKEEPKTNTTTTNSKTNTTTQKKTENKTTKTTTTNKNTNQNNVKKNEDIVVNKEDQGTKEELLIEDMNVFTVDKDGNK